MKYYRIKFEFDDVTRYRWSRQGTGPILVADGAYVAGELMTAKEMEKHKTRYLLPAPVDEFTEIVNIPKTRVHWFSGARFINEG